LSEHGNVLTLRTDRDDPKQIIEAPQVKIKKVKSCDASHQKMARI
jgi:hypothetical protein